MEDLQIVTVPVTRFQQNCLILCDNISHEGVVVDPGGDIETILAKISALNIKIKAIWITHGHIDHAGAAMALKRALNVEIIGPHIDDKFLLDQLVETAKSYNLLDDDIENCLPDQWLNDGDILTLGAHQFQVLHTPGHSPGHVVFVNHANKFVVMGDVIFAGSVGRTDLPGASHSQLMASIAQKILPLGDDFSFLCGHGPGSTIAMEKRHNPFLRGLA